MSKINREELKDIFKGIANKQEIAFNELYEKYNRLIYGITFSILKNKENSEDVVQIVFTKIWNMNKENLPTNKEATWLYRLTKNETLNFLRKQKNTANIDELYYIKDDSDKLNEMIEKDTYNKIVSKLDEKEQEIVSLKILSDLSFREISQILNMPIGTVQWKYYKSLHALKILLSNLSMFIATILLLMTQKVGKKEITKNEGTQEEGNVLEKPEITEQNTLIENDEETKQETTTKNEEKNETKNEIIENVIEEVQTPDNITFVDIGLLSLSSIFLVITIIFSIILIKHQQKHKKNVSK